MEEVIVLEVKPNYALVMAKGGGILRAKRREGMDVGERIYLLPEDVCPGAGNGKVIDFPAALRKVRSGALPRRLLASAAMLALILTLLLPNFTTTAYAVLAFAAEESLEVQVDREQTVLKAESPEDRIPKQELKALKGKNVLTLEPELERLLGGELKMVAYAPCQGELDEDFEESLRAAYEKGDRVVLAISAEQLEEVKSNEQTLGEYILSQQAEQMDLLPSEDPGPDHQDEGALAAWQARPQDDPEWVKTEVPNGSDKELTALPNQTDDLEETDDADDRDDADDPDDLDDEDDDPDGPKENDEADEGKQDGAYLPGGGSDADDDPVEDSDDQMPEADDDDDLDDDLDVGDREEDSDDDHDTKEQENHRDSDDDDDDDDDNDDNDDWCEWIEENWDVDPLFGRF